MRLASLALLLAATGCMVPQTYYTPPPSPQTVQLLTEQQATAVAADYARAWGQPVQQVTEAHLDATSRWHIGLAGPGSQAQVLVDAVSGHVLEARLGPGQPPPPRPPSAGQPAGPVQGAVPGHQDDWEE